MRVSLGEGSPLLPECDSRSLNVQNKAGRTRIVVIYADIVRAALAKLADPRQIGRRIRAIRGGQIIAVQKLLRAASDRRLIPPIRDLIKRVDFKTHAVKGAVRKSDCDRRPSGIAVLVPVIVKLVPQTRIALNRLGLRTNVR